MSDFATIESILGYQFKNRRLLQQALTHSSCSGKVSENYERLEFLGDRVLGVAVAEMLYNAFPQEPEGSLSQRHTSLVCKEAVSDVVRHLGLDKYVRISSEDIRENDNVLCDVGEAIIGAIYIDGGSDKALDYVRRIWHGLIHKDLTPPKDSKTLLQEVAHTKGLSAPVYEVVSREGAEHEPIFHISVSFDDGLKVIGIGRNKKLAEQDAASKMLQQLGVPHGH